MCQRPSNCSKKHSLGQELPGTKIRHGVTVYLPRRQAAPWFDARTGIGHSSRSAGWLAHDRGHTPRTHLALSYTRVSEVLARVTARTHDEPRGPDVEHRIRVPRAWLDAGLAVEFELPRNLCCAACKGGGCDVCQRSGAISLRGGQELPRWRYGSLRPKRTMLICTRPRHRLKYRHPEPV